ncbi:DgyrCDS14945 [Dimorphilus gyrociliatus]|uniref:DgyrCDS14945 n=1 Tax=Dimorphilus gyrociliatus TaxID=2664684 RepID=A0A7I8WFK5_9ANNE|nr:DgyrCDS14945 [Dimorphilus gyrociliatus]
MITFLEFNKEIEILELKGNVLKENDENSFLTALLSLQIVKHLKLPLIDHKEMIWKKEKLSQNCKSLINLKLLDLGENSLEHECITDFFEQVLQSSKYLYTLFLRKSKISSKVINIMSNSYRQVTSKTENLQKHKLYMIFNSCEFDLKLDDITKFFNGMFYFIDLDISHTKAQLVIDNLSNLKSLEQIENLILAKCQLTSNDLAKIGKCIHIFTYIDTLEITSQLNSTQISHLKAAIEKNISFQTLQAFLIDDKNISEHVLEYNDNNVKDKCSDLVTFLLEHIKTNCTNLTLLRLSNCSFQYGFGHIVGDAICKQSLLTKLFLSDNPIGTEVGKSIFENIKRNCTKLTALDLSNCGFQSGIGDVVGDAIGKQTLLTGLYLSDNPIGTEVGKSIFENIKTNCQKLKSINFNNCGFESGIGDVVGDAIGKQTLLTQLPLNHNAIGTEVGKSIFENIKTNCTKLTVIDFQNCGFESGIGHVVGDAIGKQTVLTWLSLRDNPIGTEVGKSIFENIKTNCTKLTVIDFKNCGFEPGIGHVVGDAIGKQTLLTGLYLSDNPIGTEVGKSIFENIKTNCLKLKSINFNNCGFESGIGDVVGDAIDIDFQNCGFESGIGHVVGDAIGIGPVVGNAIGKQTLLTELFLSDNPIGTEVGKSIFENIKTNCTQLTDIDFQNCGFESGIGHVVANAIGKQTLLTWLSLTDNPIGTEVGKSIFENIKTNCTKLTVIDFKNCGFESGIGPVVGDAIGKQTLLTKLLLSNNAIGTEVGKSIFENIKTNCTQLTVIDFQNCGFVSGIGPVVGNAIGKQTLLTKLLLRNNPIGTEVGKSIFENIKTNCTKLTHIDFQNCGFESGIGPVMGDAIGKQTLLTKLLLRNNPIGTEVGKSIFENIKTNCTKLTVIDFQNCGFESGIGPVVGDAIGKQTLLMWLSLTNNPIGTEVGKSIFENIKTNCTKLTVIDFKNCGFESGIGPVVGDAIGKQTLLTKLLLSNNAIGTEVGKSIFENIKTNCTQLTVIDFQNCGFESGIGHVVADAIGKQTLLTWLSLSNNVIGTEVGKSIFENIKTNCTKLTHIDFQNCGFESGIGHVVGNAIGKQTLLTWLSLRDNPIGTEVGKSIFENIKTNCTKLTHIDFQNCGFESGIGHVVGNAIGKQTLLTWLSLSNNAIGTEVGKSIFENIKTNCTQLTVIDFKNCGFESGIGHVVADAIGKQTLLTWLSLSNNAIGTEVGKSIFENIKTNCTKLTHIDFQNCGFESGIGPIVGDAIGKQTLLMWLSLSNNPIGTEVGKSIFENIKTNCTKLTDIDFQNCGFG